MSNPPIDRRTLNRLTAYRTSMLSAIGHLQGIEADTTHPRTWQPPHAPPRGTSDTQVCKGCHSTGHHYTECRNHTYVWDSSENARLLAPGECLSRPTSGLDIHQASLHHLLRTVIQYYISIHHAHGRDIDCLLTESIVNSEFGDLSC